MAATSSKFIAAAVLVTVAAAAFAYEWRDESSLRRQVATQEQTIAALQQRIEVAQVDWPAIAARTQASVVMIESGDSIGSGWVAHNDGKSSEIVTNFHVVADAWTNGHADVRVHQLDSAWPGTVVRVDRSDDLAVIEVSRPLAALSSATQRPRPGTAVMSLGSPLGLDGTVTIGIVSAYRSLEGSNYLQFSAAISPGNSGGPVIDSYGRVVGIATAKLVYPGAEGLALAIPVAVACDSLVVCSVSPM